YGIDGLWSAVSITVGSPQQDINVLVSTTSKDILVVGQDACGNSTTCGDSRGELFNTSASTSWQDVGSFTLIELGFDGNADIGFDNVELTNGVVASSQAIGVFNQTGYWLGILGLGVATTNLTTLDPPGIINNLVDGQTIPSHSYGYTAGAHYRLKGVPSSVTLGGYDANRFDSHNISFSLNPTRSPVVALNKISVSASPSSPSDAAPSWPSNLQELMDVSEAALFTIDSSTPFLWFPESVCLQFENALGLVYDTTLNLYTFGSDQEQYSTLVAWNMTFTFTLSDLPGSANELNITVPYDAFDLELSYPFPGLNATASSPATKYFPLRKAADAYVYTIGRAFLQEAYLIVDYERNNFSVYQAQFNADRLPATNLVAISAVSTGTSSSGATGSIGAGTHIGVAIAGSALGITAIVGVCLFIYRSRAGNISWLQFCRRRNPNRSSLQQLNSEAQLKAELGGNGEFVEMSATELPAELPAGRFGEIKELL
ncbi:aspartic peptidase domain-containing protein, partial [Leptodontidium sp. 2 PMI_412]